MGSSSSKLDIPDLSGKVAIVTGATRGIGFQTAQQLANAGARVYLAARNEEQARARIDQIRREAPRDVDIHFLKLELSDIKGVKKAAESVVEREERIDILVNNAAVLASNAIRTKEGFDYQMIANQIGTFVFTTTLLPLLSKTAQIKGTDVRIVTLSSAMYSRVPKGTNFGRQDFTLAQDEPPVTPFMTQMARYGRTKLANMLFAKELQRRLDADNIPIISLSLHPGGVATEGSADFARKFSYIGWLVHFLIATFAKSPLDGARTSLFAAAHPNIKHKKDIYGGAYLTPYDRVTPTTTPESNDLAVAKRLWVTSEEIAEELLA